MYDSYYVVNRINKKDKEGKMTFYLIICENLYLVLYLY